MFYFLVFAFCLVNSQTDFCGFFCECGFQNVTCTNTPSFPVFENPGNIRALTLKDSSFSRIPSLSRFSSLRDIALINTPNINCEQTAYLEAVGLTVHTDKICHDPDRVTDTVFETSTPNYDTQYYDTTLFELSTVDFQTTTPTSVPEAVREDQSHLSSEDNDEKVNLESSGKIIGLSVTSIILVSISIFIFIVVVTLAIIRIYKKSKYRLRPIVRPGSRLHDSAL